VDEYFGPFKRGTAEDGSPEKFIFESKSNRRAGKLEVTHLYHIGYFDWERFWGRGMTMPQLKDPLKEQLANAVFFQHFLCFALNAGETITAQPYVLTYLPPWLRFIVVSPEVPSPGLSLLSRNVKPLPRTHNFARMYLVVTFSSRNQNFLDSLWRLIRDQRPSGLRILFGCS
jgi:hypothetical protein